MKTNFKNLFFIIVVISTDIIFFSLGFMYGFWMKPTIDMDTLMKAQEKTSCEGIELFYHNTTFLDDALELFDTIGEYNNSEINGTIATPKQIYDRSFPFDCEDVSHTIMCLKKFYNDYWCEYYYRTNHSGIMCRTSESPLWVVW